MNRIVAVFIEIIVPNSSSPRPVELIFDKGAERRFRAGGRQSVSYRLINSFPFRELPSNRAAHSHNIPKMLLAVAFLRMQLSILGMFGQSLTPPDRLK
jgi:hypothetical protein